MLSLIPKLKFISWTALLDKALQSFFLEFGDSFKLSKSGKWIICNPKLKRPLIKHFLIDSILNFLKMEIEKNEFPSWIFVLNSFSDSSDIEMKEIDVNFDLSLLLDISNRLFLKLLTSPSLIGKNKNLKIWFLRHSEIHSENDLRKIVLKIFHQVEDVDFSNLSSQEDLKVLKQNAKDQNEISKLVFDEIKYFLKEKTENDITRKNQSN